jgi:hypothetical protein
MMRRPNIRPTKGAKSGKQTRVDSICGSLCGALGVSLTALERPFRNSIGPPVRAAAIARASNLQGIDLPRGDRLGAAPPSVETRRPNHWENARTDAGNTFITQEEMSAPLPGLQRLLCRVIGPSWRRNNPRPFHARNK